MVVSRSRTEVGRWNACEGGRVVVKSYALFLDPVRCQSILMTCWWICGSWIFSNRFVLPLRFWFPNPILRANSLSIAMWSWSSSKRDALGLFWDISRVLVENFNWLPFTPLWSPYPVLQLVSKLVWSLVGFNRLCDPKATWRKVP
jgi:hypothetical protein